MKIKIDKLKIKWKMFAFMLIFSGLLLAILWIFQTILLKDMYKMIRTREMQKTINYVEENIDAEDFNTMVEYISVKNDIIIAPTREFVKPDDSQPQPPKHEQMDRKGRMDFRLVAPEVITKEMVFIDTAGEELALTFYAVITPVNATVTTLRYQLYLITAIMVGLSVLLALLMARRVAKPIEEINKSAKRLSKGDYETEFEGKGYLEIAELSDTLNTAAKELNKTENLRRELLANISHDLRTPLSLIYSYAEMMHDFPDEIEPDQTQVIMDETRRLTSLVNDVFDIAKLESGTQQIVKAKFNLTKSLKETVERMTQLVKKDGYQITFDWTEEVYVEADEVKIMQAFYNLLLNAIHYSGEDKIIEVRQIIEKDGVKAAVIDHGEGIEEESFPYIWDRYYKVDKKHKRAVTGTGLGLSIVKNIMKLHQGKYGVESEVGKGSCFWIYLKIEK